MTDRFRSLTSRLVLTAVALVLAISIIIGALTAWVVRDYLRDQLDDQVEGALGRASNAPAMAYLESSEPPGDAGTGDGRDPRFGQGEATLVAYFVDPSVVPGSSGTGDVVDRRGDLEPLTSDVLSVLAALDADRDEQTVELPGLGSYRVAVAETAYGTVVAGLPTRTIDDAVQTLVTAELVLIATGTATAVLAGLVLVRRQVRPLKEVAATAHRVSELPLDSGEIELGERVPDHLVDERTEVGQVGAALNTLLAHVETSLDARHRSEQQVRQFVADASHELRTPLTTIVGYTELARRRPDDADAQRTALGKVTEESRRMTSLIEDLLLLARLDSGRPLGRDPVDLTRLLLEAVSDARVVAPDHHWRLDLPDDTVEVVGDEQRLHQVVTNLLGNARRYTPAGTTVTVTARPGMIHVHDDGPGFPPDIVPRAFERFVRGDEARTRHDTTAPAGSGDASTGLGLALVEAIVSAHGGTVTLRSAPGDTSIIIALPSRHGQFEV